MESAVKAIIGEDFFGENYVENSSDFIEEWCTEEEMTLRMLEWDASLNEVISSEQKSIVITELIKVRDYLQSSISRLNEKGVYFRGLDEMRPLEDILEELCCSE